MLKRLVLSIRSFVLWLHWSKIIGSSSLSLGHWIFTLEKDKYMLVSLLFYCSLPLLFDRQRKCHQTSWNKVDLKYLPSSNNIVSVYFHQGNKCLLQQGGRQLDKWITHWCRRLETAYSINQTLCRVYWIILSIPDLTWRLTKRLYIPIKYWKTAGINTLPSPDLNPAWSPDKFECSIGTRRQLLCIALIYGIQCTEMFLSSLNALYHIAIYGLKVIKPKQTLV